LESAKAVLAVFVCQPSTADNSDDGSVLVEASNVKDGRFIFFPKITSDYNTLLLPCHKIGQIAD
jgi:hypothetical protein